MEKLNGVTRIDAQLIGRNTFGDFCGITGKYVAELYDSAGNLKWRDEFPNTIVTVGKNLFLNAFFTPPSYSVVGPFMGMISLSGFSAISATDTMSSHPGWLEAGGANPPQYAVGRATAVFGAASAGSIALSSFASFTFTATGTVKGGFICTGSGASATIDSAAGTLFSAGLFTGGDRLVGIGDVLNVSYSCLV